MLSDVAAVSDSDAWAVGVTAVASASGGSAGAGKPLLVHWDGSRWSQVTGLPAVNGSLSGITMSAHSGWAVGSFVVADHPRPLILRWDGAAWRRGARTRRRGRSVPRRGGRQLRRHGLAIGDAQVKGSLTAAECADALERELMATCLVPARRASELAVRHGHRPGRHHRGGGQDTTETSPLSMHTNAPPLEHALDRRVLAGSACSRPLGRAFTESRSRLAGRLGGRRGRQRRPGHEVDGQCVGTVSPSREDHRPRGERRPDRCCLLLADGWLGRRR